MTQELKNLMAQASKLPYTKPHEDDFISSGGDEHVVVQIDRWGCFTRQGSLSDEEAIRRQEANIAFIIAACNAIPELLEIAEKWEDHLNENI